jgi:7-cyano-7-deazaguanine synthase
LKTAVVLLSGGLDSTTVLAIAKRDGFEVIALTVQYGQRHQVELEASDRVAKAFGVKRHEVVEIPLRQFGGSALTADIEVPKDRDESEMQEIPVTYVPARNTVLLSLALALAEVVGARDIYIGVNAVDYSGYPDCRPEFIEAFERLADLATKAGVEGESFHVHAPLLTMSKVDIIRAGLYLGVDYSLTHSCYDPVNGKACGRCDSCILRKKAFEQLGTSDPVLKHLEASLG